MLNQNLYQNYMIHLKILNIDHILFQIFLQKKEENLYFQLIIKNLEQECMVKISLYAKTFRKTKEEKPIDFDNARVSVYYKPLDNNNKKSPGFKLILGNHDDQDEYQEAR